MEVTRGVATGVAYIGYIYPPKISQTFYGVKINDVKTVLIEHEY